MSAALATIAQAWHEAEQRQYSACNHCDHHRWADAELRCACPALMWGDSKPRPVQFVRLPQGGCGPEALHMSAPWLQAA